MKLSAIITAVFLPLAAIAADESTSTTTATTTLTRTIYVQNVIATEYANGTASVTGSASSTTPTAAAETQEGAASGLVPMAFAGVAGMVVVAML